MFEVLIIIGFVMEKGRFYILILFYYFLIGSFFFYVYILSFLMILRVIIEVWFLLKM